VDLRNATELLTLKWVILCNTNFILRKEGEMTQTLYAYMNKRKKKERKGRKEEEKGKEEKEGKRRGREGKEGGGGRKGGTKEVGGN
jgi:hypothetical protein